MLIKIVCTLKLSQELYIIKIEIIVVCVCFHLENKGLMNYVDQKKKLNQHAWILFFRRKIMIIHLFNNFFYYGALLINCVLYSNLKEKSLNPQH